MASYVPGDVLIDGMVITGAAGSLDVQSICQMLYIYEDFTVPGISLRNNTA